jgi:hypothetical protein
MNHGYAKRKGLGMRLMRGILLLDGEEELDDGREQYLVHIHLPFIRSFTACIARGVAEWGMA